MTKSSKGYYSLPRSLENNQGWKSYSLRYRAFFQFIVSKCLWYEDVYNIAGKDFPILPGQYMTSIRDITEEFNQTVVHKEDKLNKSTTSRILHSFSFNFLVGHATVQHAGHEKTLLTIIDQDTYDQFIRDDGTSNGTDSKKLTGQRRDSIKGKLSKTNKTTNQPNLPSKVVGLEVGAVGLVGGLPLVDEKKAAIGESGIFHAEETSDIIAIIRPKHNCDYPTHTPENQQFAPLPYSCLKDVPIEEKEKSRITAKYTESVVNKSVAHCTAPGFKPIKSLDSAIFHFCEHPENIKPTKEQSVKSKQLDQDKIDEIIAIRKAISERAHYQMKTLRNQAGDRWAANRFTVNCDSVEISGDRGAQKVNFKSPTFKNDVIHNLNKYELPIPDLVYEMP